jgi:hypothetical protein
VGHVHVCRNLFMRRELGNPNLASGPAPRQLPSQVRVVSRVGVSSPDRDGLFEKTLPQIQYCAGKEYYPDWPIIFSFAGPGMSTAITWTRWPPSWSNSYQELLLPRPLSPGRPWLLPIRRFWVFRFGGRAAKGVPRDRRVGRLGFDFWHVLQSAYEGCSEDAPGAPPGHLGVAAGAETVCPVLQVAYRDHRFEVLSR